MAKTVRELMSADPIRLKASMPIADAACAMRDRDVGSVIVTEGDNLCGIVTDRDITVRAVAEGKDLEDPLRDICSKGLATIGPDASVEDAVKLMREKAIRRIPVTDNGKALGILSLGDLALEKDPQSVLADISSAPANR